MIKLLSKIFIKEYKDYKNPEVRKKYGFLTGILGIILNVILFVGKLFAGLIAGAMSILGDAFNNLSDAGSSIITLVGFKLASTPADSKHPYGHGRIEYVAGLIVAIIVIVIGIELGKGSIEKVITPTEIKYGILSIVILCISVLIKFWMFLYNRSIGKKINSTAMKATSMDCIADVCATTSVLMGVVVFYSFGVNIDAYIGILVAIFICYTGIKTALESLSPLLGERPNPEFVKSIEWHVLSYQNIIGVHDLMVHDYGVGVVVVSLHAEVPCKMDSIKAHELIDEIEDSLKKNFKCQAVIHMDPVENDDEDTIKMKQMVCEIVNNIDEGLSIHDFRMTKGEKRNNLIFDLVVPFGFKLSDDELIYNITYEISRKDEKLHSVISIDKKSV